MQNREPGGKFSEVFSSMHQAVIKDLSRQNFGLDQLTISG